MVNVWCFPSLRYAGANAWDDLTWVFARKLTLRRLVEKVHKLGILGLGSELGTGGSWVAEIWGLKVVRPEAGVLPVDDTLNLERSGSTMIFDCDRSPWKNTKLLSSPVLDDQVVSLGNY
jgi:hypothetical protein